MGILGHAVDADHIHEVELIGGGVVGIKHTTQRALVQYTSKNMPVFGDDVEEFAEEVTSMSQKLTARYLVDNCIEYWKDDPDWTYTPDKAKELLGTQDFFELTQRLYLAAVNEDNFRMTREVAAKKFALDMPPASDDTETS